MTGPQSLRGDSRPHADTRDASPPTRQQQQRQQQRQLQQRQQQQRQQQPHGPLTTPALPQPSVAPQKSASRSDGATTVPPRVTWGPQQQQQQRGAAAWSSVSPPPPLTPRLSLSLGLSSLDSSRSATRVCSG
ncbi:unnamed protein product [Lampetra planeri]